MNPFQLNYDHMNRWHMNPSQVGRNTLPAAVLRTSLVLIVIAAVYAASSRSAIAADSRDLRAIYGRGVHALFAGKLQQAEQYFSQTIAAGSTDPRVYYFRSIVRLRLSRRFEAENDMRIGATLEARNPGYRHAISNALQRVQGSGRATLEKFRRQARLDRAQQLRAQSRNRYEQLKKRSTAVLHQDNPVRLETLMEHSGRVDVPATAPSAARDQDLFAPDSGDTDVGDIGTGKTGTEDTEAGDTGSGDTSAAEGDDESPFGFEEPVGRGESEDATEEDPADEDANDDDFFGETRASTPAEDDFWDEEVFSVAPTESPTASSTASSSTSSSAPGAVTVPPSGGPFEPESLFFELGRWLSRAAPQQPATEQLPGWPALDAQPGGVAQADFELGPAETEDDKLPDTESKPLDEDDVFSDFE